MCQARGCVERSCLDNESEPWQAPNLVALQGAFRAHFWAHFGILAFWHFGIWRVGTCTRVKSKGNTTYYSQGEGVMYECRTSVTG